MEHLQQLDLWEHSRRGECVTLELTEAACQGVACIHVNRKGLLKTGQWVLGFQKRGIIFAPAKRLLAYFHAVSNQ
jgi:hypothetical protein